MPMSGHGVPLIGHVYFRRKAAFDAKQAHPLLCERLLALPGYVLPDRLQAQHVAAAIAARLTPLDEIPLGRAVTPHIGTAGVGRAQTRILTVADLDDAGGEGKLRLGPTRP